MFMDASHVEQVLANIHQLDVYMGVGKVIRPDRSILFRDKAKGKRVKIWTRLTLQDGLVRSAQITDRRPPPTIVILRTTSTTNTTMNEVIKRLWRRTCGIPASVHHPNQRTDSLWIRLSSVPVVRLVSNNSSTADLVVLDDFSYYTGTPSTTTSIYLSIHTWTMSEGVLLKP